MARIRQITERDSLRKHVAAIHIGGKLSLLQRKLSNCLLLHAYDDLLTKSRHRIDAETLVENQYQLLNTTLIPAMQEEGIRFLRRSEWSEEQRQWIRRFFRRELLPVLSPIGLDPVAGRRRVRGHLQVSPRLRWAGFGPVSAGLASG